MDTTRSYTTFPLTNIASVRSQNFRSLLRPASKMTARNEGKSDEDYWNYRQSHPNRHQSIPVRDCQNNQMVVCLRLTFLCQGRCLPSPSAPKITCGSTWKRVSQHQDVNTRLLHPGRGKQGQVPDSNYLLFLGESVLFQRG